jgi:hypothetical protein
MARYSLRNQDKISRALGALALSNIIASLHVFFAENKTFDIQESTPYNTLVIDDKTEENATIEFYVIDTTYDVYNLAFKKFNKI